MSNASFLDPYFWKDRYTDQAHEYHNLLEKYQRLEASTHELLEEVIVNRDGLFDFCTNSKGEYDPGDEGRQDKAEIERLDGIIDRALAALGDV